ncbi:MAG: TraB/GumN family protein [Saprospiraceae bacterium]|nr:TraB/GumN family protein [Saprospiraceae bacterium]
MSRFLISLTLLLQGILLFAQPAGNNLAPTAAENSLLWEISGKGMEQPSYLFGTIHLIGKEDFILTDSTVTAFDRCAKVAFEIDLEEMTDIAAMLPLLMKAFMRNGTTLRDLLSKEDYELVNKHFADMGLPIFLLERVKPMFLSAMMGQQGGGEAMGEMKSYEIELLDMARNAGKPVAGLETAAYQMSIFDSIPYKAQADMLVQSLKSESSDSPEIDQLVERYKKQDLYGLQEMLEGESGMGEYTSLLLDTRNANWIPVMAEMMISQPVFFAVGAGHLAGARGVIALLRAEGYSLRPVR